MDRRIIDRMSLSNRSLERGLAVLECFRPGVGLLTHREVTERTGLPKATVSRLLSTLQAAGYLVFDAPLRGYRLGVPVLSLARCMALASGLRQAMAPVIARVARETSSIIGFGTAHDTDIVYLEAANGDPERESRNVGVGMRAPIATTSVGHGYLAGLPAAERDPLLERLCAESSAVRKPIEASLRQVREHGHCLVLYVGGEQAAIGVPVPLPGAPLHAFGIGYRVPPGCPPREVPAHIIDAKHALLARAAGLDPPA